MTAKQIQNHKARKTILLFFLLIFLTMPFLNTPAAADDRREARELVEKTQWMLEGTEGDPHFEEFRKLIKQAKGIFMVPHLWKGGFVIGALGGHGVLMVRDERGNRWNGPAFYTLGGASYGPQVGGEVSETVFLIMSQRGVTSFLSNNFKLGADVSVSAGPVGRGTSAATANLSADILSFSRSRGLYAGASLSGAVIAVRSDMNRAYFGQRVSPTDILVRREVFNDEAQKLIEEIEKLSTFGKEQGQRT
ncbi:MAG: lipid-binding SYLF domain-containing protein [Thermodesulfobacteriota bacterium]